MFESLFVFLFKYHPLVFERGDFIFAASRTMRMAVVAIAVIGVGVIWTYRRLGAVTSRDRAMLMGVRVALLGLAIFALLRPTLQLKTAVPQQNFVGVLLDDSRSMQVADHDGQPRADYIRDDVARVDSPLLTELNKRFQIRVYRFSSTASRLMTTGDLQFAGTSTRLGETLDRVRDEMSGLPVAGLVMVSDGGDNSQASLDEPIESLKAASMPVFTVGVGQESLTRDVQVTRAETPRRALKGSALVVDVTVTQTGYAGARVPLIVEDEGRMVSTQDITLPADGESATVKVRFKAFDAGPRRYRFRIPVQNNEEVTQNNARDRLVDVIDRRESILYVEGEPRFEPKFVRMATESDDNLRVALLQRTAMATSESPDKFYRMGLERPDELQNGFPATREELFQYRGLILGTIEASAFSPEQQRMLEEFVDVRGGGLLMLGGPRSFAEGGWAGTPLSNALPVVLERGAGRKPIYPPIDVVIKPTPAGAAHPATQIADTAEATAAKWNELPALTTVNHVVDVKPGATVLLTGLPSRGSDVIALAYQRYGRGKALALPMQDVWMWRMHQKMDVKDETHFTFWKRLARWLVDGVPDRVMVMSRPEQVQRGEPVSISADVFDKEFKGINDGQVTARIRMPSGRTEDVPMDWTVEHEGEYAARFTPTEDGVHTITVTGSRTGEEPSRGSSHFLVAASDAEFFDAAMQAPVLRRLAEDTGGRFFRAGDTSKLVDAITYSGKGITVVEDNELWDMPALLFLLLALMGAEWMYRRRKGLA